MNPATKRRRGSAEPPRTATTGTTPPRWKRYLAGRARPWLALGAALVLLAGAVVLGRGLFVDDASPTERACRVDPPDGEAAISRAIGACPNGSTVRFPPNRQYTVGARIEIRDRRDLTIDGNGSAFTNTADGSDTQEVNPVWLVLRGHNITLQNMTAIGSFDVPGPRDLSKLQPPRFTEAAPGFGIYGADTVKLLDVKALRVWGDGVTTGPAHYADPHHVGDADFTKNVVVDRMSVETTGRMCWGPTSGENIVIQNSSCVDAWYGGLDAEADNFLQPVRAQKYLNNTFDGFGNFGIFIPVAGEPGYTRDIEIRGNRFLTEPDKECGATIGIGGYPDTNPRTFEDVVVEGNEIRFVAVGVWLDHVRTGSVTNNTLVRVPPPAAFTPAGWCGSDEPVRVTNSTGVVVEANR